MSMGDIQQRTIGVQDHAELLRASKQLRQAHQDFVGAQRRVTHSAEMLTNARLAMQAAIVAMDSVMGTLRGKL